MKKQGTLKALIIDVVLVVALIFFLAWLAEQGAGRNASMHGGYGIEKGR